jgi:hypothetical protein
MCKFHQSVAREIATNPATRHFDPVLYSVALVAMAKYRIEQYMPSMSECDGNSPYVMASSAGVSAFERSGLTDKIVANDGTDIAILRLAMAATLRAQGMTLAGLNLPKDPVKDGTFLDEAAVDLYEDYTAPGYAARPLTLKAVAHKPAFEPIRAATEHFLKEIGVVDALRRSFERSIVTIFSEAPSQVNPFLLRAYDRVPTGLRNVFKTCAMCAGSGAGGALVSHVGCIVVPVLAGATGTAISGAAMTGMMLVSSPLIAAGVTYGLDRWRGMKTSALRLGGAASIAFAVALGIGAIGGHEGHDMPEGGHDGHHQNHDGHHGHHQAATITPEAQEWYDGLTQDQQKQMQDAAKATGEDLAVYLNAMCITKPLKEQGKLVITPQLQ